MRRTLLPSLAASSVLLLAVAAAAATRPHYGGRLRIEMRAAPGSLDPADRDAYAPNAAAREKISALMFDTLTRLDASGRPQPRLATSWQGDAEGKHWEFWLRTVDLHDGSELTPQIVAASLSAANPRWKVRAQPDSVVIEPDTPMPNLPAELARTRNSIVKRDGGLLIGSGPFKLAQQSQPLHRLVLAADENYWAGRPFVDAVEIQMARSQRDQFLDLQLGKADVIDVAPEAVRSATRQGQRILSSSSTDLVALVFARGRPAVEDQRVREVIASTADRNAIQTVLLQRQGEATAALLPQWMSGYAFLFPSARDLPHALQVRAELPPVPALTLVYDSADPLAQQVAERIALNVREAGLNIQTFGEMMSVRSGNADMRLVRVHLASADPATALAVITADLDLPAPSPAATPEQFYAAERALLQDFRVVPLVVVPQSVGLGARVHDWTELPSGAWQLEDVWLEAGQ